MQHGSVHDVSARSSASLRSADTHVTFPITKIQHFVHLYVPLPEWYLFLRHRYQPHRILHKSVHPVLLTRKKRSFSSSFTKISFLEFLSFISSQVIPIFSNNSSVCLGKTPLSQGKCKISHSKDSISLIYYHVVYLSVSGSILCLTCYKIDHDNLLHLL